MSLRWRRLRRRKKKKEDASRAMPTDFFFIAAGHQDQWLAQDCRSYVSSLASPTSSQEEEGGCITSNANGFLLYSGRRLTSHVCPWRSQNANWLPANHETISPHDLQTIAGLRLAVTASKQSHFFIFLKRFDLPDRVRNPPLLSRRPKHSRMQALDGRTYPCQQGKIARLLRQ